MSILYPITANLLVASGLFIIIRALLPIRKLIEQLPPGSIRQKWYYQGVLILIFIFGYLGYAIAFWGHYTNWSDLIVPAVFFFGAHFVWMTISLSFQTVMDIRRVALLEQESITDPLIGVYNRRYLDRRLGEEFNRAKRYKHDLAVLLIDIDHFKRVNDTYGHQVGDLVLRYWGSLILDVSRASDIVARYGGDEILVISPNTTPAMALTFAERIRSNIESHEFAITTENVQPKVIRITVTIGVSGLTPQENQLEMLINEADQALLDAKRRGRNRVELSIQNKNILKESG